MKQELRDGIADRDSEIETLKAELKALRGGKQPEATVKDEKLRNIQGK